MRTALVAELRKFRFTRSLWALLVAGAALSVVGAALVIGFFKSQDLADHLSAHGPLRFGPTNIGLILLVFAIRVFADETHHHTLASTYIATPQRRRVLVAKATVAACAAVAFCVFVFALVIPITLVGIRARDIPMTIDIAATGGLLLRTTAAMTLTVVIGVALAAVVRNRAFVLVVSLAWLSLGENVAGALLGMPELLPGAAVRALVSGSGGRDALSAAPAGLVLLALATAAMLAALTRLNDDVA